MKIGANPPVVAAPPRLERSLKESNRQQQMPIKIGRDDVVIMTPQQVGYYIYKSNSPKAQLMGSSTSNLPSDRPYVAGSIIRIAV